MKNQEVSKYLIEFVLPNWWLSCVLNWMLETIECYNVIKYGQGDQFQ